MTPKLSNGRIVHYVLKEGRSAGQSRAAMVVNAWDGDSPHVNLHVYLDGHNDQGSEFEKKGVAAQVEHPSHNAEILLGHAYSSPYDSEGKMPGSWHWPELV